jgi:hypothetical protein
VNISIALRKLLHLNWACQGCGQLGSYRWLKRHSCPERDRLEAEWKRCDGEAWVFYSWADR